MSSEDASDESESEDAAPDKPDQPDSEEAEPIDADELMEKMQARRDQQREQVTYDWCETIRDAGERYCEHGDVNAVADDLQLAPDEVREAITVYRLRFKKSPGTAAWIADKVGRAFFTPDADVDEAVDLEDRDYRIGDLVREYVGAVYLEYDVDAEPIGNPVEQDAPDLPFDVEEMSERLREAVSVPTEAIASNMLDGVHEILARQMTIPSEVVLAVSRIDDWHESLLASHASAVNAAIDPMLDRQREALLSAVQPVLDQIAMQQRSVAVTALKPMMHALDDLMFPEELLADLTTIQRAIDAAALSTPSAAAVAAADYSSTGYSSVSFPEPTPRPSRSPSPTSPSPSPSQGSEPGEPPVEQSEPWMGSDPPDVDGMVSSTVDATLPRGDTVSAELMFEVPALMVESILGAGEVRTWFTQLPYGHQISMVNVVLVSSTYYVTGSASWAALCVILSPAMRQMIIDEDEE